MRLRLRVRVRVRGRGRGRGRVTHLHVHLAHGSQPARASHVEEGGREPIASEHEHHRRHAGEQLHVEPVRIDQVIDGAHGSEPFCLEQLHLDEHQADQLATAQHTWIGLGSGVGLGSRFGLGSVIAKPHPAHLS